ncbi:uncharacterized protein LOC124267998 [Haliotis rubra]|uniref:uncharacterized protein LOC124267998 n=1 Tax=Haliotis rubra TaxID=36100 RepID=UPI001EE5F121|nr:uncharacterized protein LOC124267998 [Haliotis rubra]
MTNQQLDYKFLPTSRGGRYLVVEGFVFRLNRRRNDASWASWRCQEKTCAATVSTVNDIITKHPSPHNHGPVHNEIKVRETLDRMKMVAKSSLGPIPTLYNEVLASVSDGPWTEENRSFIAEMPTYDTVKNRLYQARRSTFPPIPSSRREIVIPDEFKTTNAGEPFVIINDGDDDKILGMTTTVNMQHLCAAEVVYKATVTYDRAFRLLKEAVEARGLQMSPQHIQMDFESAAKNAVSVNFPTTLWRGCLFHYTQCVWKKTQGVGLQGDYNHDEDITRFVRRAAVLPLVPVTDVDDVWLNALADMPDDPRCLRLADYVTTQWVEGHIPQTAWNHYQNTGPRTNNHLEGWHGRLKKIISKAHPNVFEMLSFLRKEQKLNEIKLVQYAAGRKPPPKRRKYIHVKSRLETLKQELRDGAMSVMVYAYAVSHLMKLQ